MNNNLSDYLGILAVIITLVYTSLGFPVQIKNNYKRKTTKGLSLFFMVMSTSTFFVWSTYAYSKNPIDWYMFFSNIPGIIFGIIILFQFWYYRKRGDE